MKTIPSREKSTLPFSVNERDIDLLLIEQLHVSPGFASKFIAALGFQGATVESVEHSVYREHGETDVLLTLGLGGQCFAVMIEDKIGAPMQPDQCERYHLRGQVLCATGVVDSYRTVLCAPADYIAGIPPSQGWHIRLSLEDISAIVAEERFPGWEWRGAVLASAVSRSNRARAASVSARYDPVIAPLKAAYRGYVLGHYPEIKASVQAGPDREYFLGMVGLPGGIRFKHAFFAGEVSLIFEKKWVETAQQVLTGALPEDAWFVQHGSELHVRLSTEVLDPDLPLELQTQLVTDALEKLLRLASLGRAVADCPT